MAEERESSADSFTSANEGTPLIWRAVGKPSLPSPASSSPSPSSPSFLAKLNALVLRAIDACNPCVSRRPWRLFEICDLWLFPPFLRRRCQAMLTAEWTHRLPLLQSASPAELAAEVILGALDEIDGADADGDGEGLTVVDFCSGGGGPVPVIERLVNQKRAQRKQQPIPFRLTDISPHIDAWMAAAAQSSHLSFVPQSVDATDPPPAVISTTNNSPSDPEYTSGTRVFRLYCLAFHHFPDDLARRTLVSTLGTADGFAILELQDRRLLSLLMMALDFGLVLLVTPFWFWNDPLQLLFTYLLPVLPAVLSFDGAVSALRTRTFGEVVRLVEAGREGEAGVVGEVGTLERWGWRFRGGRELHTWPIGYFNYVVGTRVQGGGGGGL
ncbi:uncharacterized protein K452DRAFT_228869 [Aplosporella prunicola CBS 121167]|uniref:Methyltransferase domain-containing protein n=1 Tax=Aplosporella prunicola CBS 121167 TaxID=1176127 RepID=A0A6A6BDD1_9PEZI|nr:uncharacterized protein K452DRAFT_228869 [Aplosporella prunicola CBS 121167]KAF2141383.1 hypothetical protein K452DRAFT_228869 [Aplosporella prunicola CBS 121167]